MHGLFLYLVFVLEQNACIIVPARILTDGDRFDPVIFWYGSVLFDLHIPCFWKLQAPIFKGYRAFLVIRCIRGAGFVFGFEIGKSNFRIPEEVIICLFADSSVHSQVPDCQPLSATEILFVLRRGIIQFLFRFLVIFDFIIQHFIIDEPYTAKRFGKQCFCSLFGYILNLYALFAIRPAPFAAFSPCDSIYFLMTSIGAPPVVSRQKLWLQKHSFHSFCRICGNSFSGVGCLHFYMHL